MQPLGIEDRKNAQLAAHTTIIFIEAAIFASCSNEL
jgi:hypothetical protein